MDFFTYVSKNNYLYLDSTIIFWKKQKYLWKHFYTMKKPLKNRANVVFETKTLFHLFADIRKCYFAQNRPE